MVLRSNIGSTLSYYILQSSAKVPYQYLFNIDLKLRSMTDLKFTQGWFY